MTPGPDPGPGPGLPPAFATKVRATGKGDRPQLKTGRRHCSDSAHATHDTLYTRAHSTARSPRTTIITRSRLGFSRARGLRVTHADCTFCVRVASEKGHMGDTFCVVWFGSEDGEIGAVCST